MTVTPEMEDRIQALVDGALAGAERAALERELAGQPEAAQLLQRWQAQRQAIRATLPDPDPRALSALLARAAARRPAPLAWPRRAAGIGIFALGLAFGYGAAQIGAPVTTGPHEVQTAEAAAAAHALYAVEVVHPVEVGAGERDHLMGWLTKRLGVEINAPDLSAAGYSLVGGRLLPFAETAAAQFMYDSDSGTRITLYITTRPEAEARSVRFYSAGDLSVAAWQDGHLRQALVGDLPRETLEALAVRLARGGA